jgi:hypothetical protein
MTGLFFDPMLSSAQRGNSLLASMSSTAVENVAENAILGNS